MAEHRESPAEPAKADDDRKNPLGPTGREVRRNIQRLREVKGLTKRDLSERVRAAGRPIPPLGISRIEAGDRRVDADDLVALAVALGVNPSALLLPPVADLDEIEVTGFGSVAAALAWQWMDGVMPLTRSGATPNDEYLEFQLRARPPGRRMLGIVDPESPDWSPERATAGERAAAEEILFHRREYQLERLVRLQEERRSIEATTTDAERPAELDRIESEERDAHAILARLDEVRVKAGLGSERAD